MSTSLTPTSTVRLQGVVLDTSGQQVVWNPDPMVDTTTNTGNIPAITIAALAQVQVVATTEIGATGVIMLTRTAGNPVTIQGATNDIGFQIPPGGFFLYPLTIGSNIWITNPGSVAVTVYVGAV